MLLSEMLLNVGYIFSLIVKAGTIKMKKLLIIKLAVFPLLMNYLYYLESLVFLVCIDKFYKSMKARSSVRTFTRDSVPVIIWFSGDKLTINILWIYVVQCIILIVFAIWSAAMALTVALSLLQLLYRYILNLSDFYWVWIFPVPYLRWFVLYIKWKKILLRFNKIRIPIDLSNFFSTNF